MGTSDVAAPPALRVRLFGELDLRLGEQPLPALDSARAESLLAYLLLHRDAPQPRQRLAFLLWPDSSEPQARANLRHVLHNLRRALPDADRYLEVTPRTLRWRPEAPFWLDVAAFEAALDRAGADPEEALRAAVASYAGDLLEGSYDDWVLEERERLRDRYLEALDRLSVLLAERGEHDEAIRHAERLLRHDPLRETTYRLLMRLHEARGDRARALRVYHACSAALARELGIDPSAETRQLYEALVPDREPAAAEPAPAGARGLVGRVDEYERLTSLWHASERGRAQLVLVSGEAGIGKTRLVEELRAWCAARGAVTAEARSYPAEGALAYGPVVTWLRSEPLAARRRRLNRGRLAELARVLPEVGLSPPALPAAEQRQRLFAALAAALLAAPGPLLLVADDAHWADPETLRFLHYLVRSEPGAPLLVAATARSEGVDDRHPLHELVDGLQALDRCAEIELDRLSRGETVVLAERLSAGALDAAAADRLFARSEGNPLFVVEAVRMGGEAAASPRVQAVIQARLAQLSEPGRALAGVAAAVGREFTADVLAEASGLDEAALVGGLDELWRRRIVRDRGPDAYDFSHDLIREVAYRAIAPARRRRTHLRVARALERLGAPDPGELAVQYERAAAADQAVAWYVRAAEAAQRLHANAETVALLERARRLVGAVPDRESRELVLVMAALAPLGMAEGFGSRRLRELQRRGLELAARLGVEPEPPLLRSLALTALSGHDFAQARGYGERMRLRAERDGDDVLLVECHYVLGIAAFWQGGLHAARDHFVAAVERYRPEHRTTHLVRYGLDPKVVCLSRLGNTLWFLGQPGAAAETLDRALAVAEEVAHPASTAIALVFAAMLALELRDLEAMRRVTAALAATPTEGVVRVTGSSLELFAGYLEVVDGAPARGLARIRDVLASTPEIEHAPGLGASVARVLAEACLVAGDARAGLDAAELLVGTTTGVRLWEAEALRLRAEFRAALGADQAEVAADLERALEVARRQGARSLELRAAESLERLRRGTLAERSTAHAAPS